MLNTSTYQLWYVSMIICMCLLLEVYQVDDVKKSQERMRGRGERERQRDRETETHMLHVPHIHVYTGFPLYGGH